MVPLTNADLLVQAPILLGLCPSLSARESESMLQTYLVCKENLLAMLEVALRLRDDLDWNFSPISHNSGLLTSYYD
jgi:hypothetical protein